MVRSVFSKIYGPDWSGPEFRLVTFGPVRVLKIAWSGPGFGHTRKIISLLLGTISFK
jgi:hypothetical protein